MLSPCCIALIIVLIIVIGALTAGWVYIKDWIYRLEN